MGGGRPPPREGRLEPPGAGRGGEDPPLEASWRELSPGTPWTVLGPRDLRHVVPRTAGEDGFLWIAAVQREVLCDGCPPATEQESWFPSSPSRR